MEELKSKESFTFSTINSAIACIGVGTTIAYLKYILSNCSYRLQVETGTAINTKLPS
jgi:hypothetical protein